jgi:hypothetical protein
MLFPLLPYVYIILQLHKTCTRFNKKETKDDLIFAIEYILTGMHISNMTYYVDMQRLEVNVFYWNSLIVDGTCRGL